MTNPQYCSHMPVMRQRDQYANAIPRSHPNWSMTIRETCRACGIVLIEHIAKPEPDPMKWGGKAQYSETAVESFSPELPR